MKLFKRVIKFSSRPTHLWQSSYFPKCFCIQQIFKSTVTFLVTFLVHSLALPLMKCCLQQGVEERVFCYCCCYSGVFAGQNPWVISDLSITNVILVHPDLHTTVLLLLFFKIPTSMQTQIAYLKELRIEFREHHKLDDTMNSDIGLAGASVMSRSRINEPDGYRDCS